jgi:hypothetical protein
VSREAGRQAVELLAQFAPDDVLARAKALARQIERDEQVRSYLARRGLLIVAAGIAAMALGGALAYGFLAVALPGAGSAPWWRWPALLLAGLLWLAVSLGLMTLVLSALQRAALRKAAPAGDRLPT